LRTAPTHSIRKIAYQRRPNMLIAPFPEIPPTAIKILPPRIDRALGPSRCVFPFCFCGQPFPSLGTVFYCIHPGDPHDWVVSVI
jgi:hypothetical protein